MRDYKEYEYDYYRLSLNGESIIINTTETKLLRPANQIIQFDHFRVAILAILYPEGKLYYHYLNFGTEKSLFENIKISAINNTDVSPFVDTVVIFLTVKGNYYFINQNNDRIPLENTKGKINKYIKETYELSNEERALFYK